MLNNLCDVKEHQLSMKMPVGSADQEKQLEATETVKKVLRIIL